MSNPGHLRSELVTCHDHRWLHGGARERVTEGRNDPHDISIAPEADVEIAVWSQRCSGWLGDGDAACGSENRLVDLIHESVTSVAVGKETHNKDSSFSTSIDRINGVCDWIKCELRGIERGAGHCAETCGG